MFNDPTPGLGCQRVKFTAAVTTCILLSIGGSAFAQDDPAPALEDIYFISQATDGVYLLGDRIRLHARANRVDFEVTGQPQLALTIGDDTRYAEFRTIHTYQGESRYLYFEYFVQASDRDDDGVAIPADAVTLNGGAIKDGAGRDADLSLPGKPDDPAHRVDGSIDPTALPLSVTGVGFLNRPANGDTYGPGDEIAAVVEFNRPFAVTGDPRLVLQIGGRTRSADLYFTRPDSLWFRYYVKASDVDDDGIGIPADALRLNRGTIRDPEGNDADLAHEAVPDDPRRRVDGRLDAVPTIAGLAANRTPGGVFIRGGVLIVVVRFSEPVEATGLPQLAIDVGGQTRQADLHRRQGTRLYFEYIVQASDVDEDGFSVPANALTLNGGSIRDADGNDADLTHDALPADSNRRVDGASTVPTVARVRFSRFPASQDAYAAGETIFAVATFTRRVQTTGAPQLTLQIGEQARQAEHLPTLRAAELLPFSGYHNPEEQAHVYFQYVVQPSDVDDDGISVPDNALTLNGGSIQAWGGSVDARLDHAGLPDDPSRKVDGSRADDHAPVVSDAYIANAPVSGAFRAGETITVGLRFDEGVVVTGLPRFALQIGSESRYAAFHESWGTATLLFEYVVQETDRDDNGLSILADAIDLNGGTMRDGTGNDANLDLGYFTFNDDPNYKVNGMTPVPALPLAGSLTLLLALVGYGWRRLAR